MGEPNVLLAALLEEAQISRAGLATRINRLSNSDGRNTTYYDHTSVGRWTKLGSRPRGSTPEYICQILSDRLGRAVTLADIGMEERGAPSEVSPQQLTSLITNSSALWRSDSQGGIDNGISLQEGPNSLVPLALWENPPEWKSVANEGNYHVSAKDLELLQAARQRYEQMYRLVGGPAVRPRIAAFLHTRCAELLKGNYSDEIGRQLYRTVGGLVALAGICAYDSDAHGVAQKYYYSALSMAKAAQDKQFGAYVVGLLTTQAIHLDQPAQAIRFAETGLRAAKSLITPALATDLNTLQAKAYARLSDPTQSRLYMQAAEQYYNRIVAENEPAEMSYVGLGFLETQHAETLRRLGDLAAAREFAQLALNQAHTGHARGRANRQFSLARVLFEEGEIEASVAAAEEMLLVVQSTESRRLHDRLASLARSMHSHKHVTNVGEFLEKTQMVLKLPILNR